MQLAATRGKLMELVTHAVNPHNSSRIDRAFMVGMLSLLDTLMNESLSTILKRINLDEEIETALLERSGDLGELLKLCMELEAGGAVAVQEKLHTLPNLTADALNKAHLEALGWANRIAI